MSTEFLPFQGIYFNHDKVRGSDVLAPPYDIIAPEKREELYGRSAFNVVRIDFGRDLPGDDASSVNRYTRARDYFADWLKKDILRRHRKDAFYIYESEYQHAGKGLRLRGVIGRLRLVELGKGVYPHEETHSNPKKDRLNLLRYCRANVSPIFALYSSREASAKRVIDDLVARPPYLEAVDDDGSSHRMWIADGDNDVAAIKAEIGGSPVFIADGHHRYETALAYQKEMHAHAGPTTSAPHDFVMMFLVNMADKGVTILPTHRLIDPVPSNALALLQHHFEVHVAGTGADVTKEIAHHEHAIGMCLAGDERLFILMPKRIDLDEVDPLLREFDVTVLHRMIFRKLFNADIITYEMDAAKCVDLVRRGQHEGAFFLNPTRVRDIERVALNGLRMPPKSTYFYPKLLTGFVMYPF